MTPRRVRAYGRQAVGGGAELGTEMSERGEYDERPFWDYVQHCRQCTTCRGVHQCDAGARLWCEVSRGDEYDLYRAQKIAIESNHAMTRKEMRAMREPKEADESDHSIMLDERALEDLVLCGRCPLPGGHDGDCRTTETSDESEGAQSWETECPKSLDRRHCQHWYDDDGQCCRCGDDSHD